MGEVSLCSGWWLMQSAQYAEESVSGVLSHKQEIYVLVPLPRSTAEEEEERP